MIRKVTAEQAINMNNSLFIDVRSEKEYLDGSIPGAINIPILNDQEREEVGTIYKQKSIDEAKEKAVNYASVKLSSIYKKISFLSQKYQNIIIFCWRGGMRSSSLVTILNTLGKNVFQLEGGFKQYRRYVIDYLENVHHYHRFIVLHGYTGVGKTEIIKELKSIDIPTLDLEGLAKNSGSVFGAIGHSESHLVTQKTFEALVFDVLRKSNSKYIVVESESKRIGNIFLPNQLYNLIISGKHLLVKTSQRERVKRLVNDYTNKGSNCHVQLKTSILKLDKWIGKERVNQYTEWIEEKAYDQVAKELIEIYYDPLYDHSINKYDYDLEINYDKIEEVIDIIKEFYYQLEGKTI